MSLFSKKQNRWMFVIVGFIINFCLGTRDTWSVLRPPLHEPPFSLTPAESILPFSLFLLFFGTMFAVSGWVVSRAGPKTPAMLGALLLGVGYMVCYAIRVAPDAALWITLVGFGVIAGTGCGFAYNPPIATTGRWFPGRPGLALGLTVMGFGLSALITAPVVSALVGRYGLANTFFILGAVFLVTIFLLGWLLRFPPDEWKPPTPVVTRPRPWASKIDYTTREMIRTPAFYLAWLTFLIGSGAGLMVIGYAKLIAMDITGLKGTFEWLATLAVSVLAISNAAGRPIFGVICDIVGPKRTLLLMLTIQLTCLVALYPNATTVPVVFLATILFGAMYGAYLAVMPTLTSYFFGIRNIGPNYGLMLIAHGIGGLLLPALMAAILGPTPTYQLYVRGFYTTAVLIIVAIGLVLAMKPPKPSASRSTSNNFHYNKEEFDHIG